MVLLPKVAFARLRCLSLAVFGAKSHNGTLTPATIVPTPAPAPVRSGTPVSSAIPVRSGTPVPSAVPVRSIVRSRSGVVRSAVVTWAAEVVKGKWEWQRDSETHSISACWLLGAQGQSRNNEKREKYLFHGSLQVVFSTRHPSGDESGSPVRTGTDARRASSKTRYRTGGKPRFL